jgi:hypothetical protein
MKLYKPFIRVDDINNSQGFVCPVQENDYELLLQIQRVIVPILADESLSVL